jgi:hypothetical protein
MRFRTLQMAISIISVPGKSIPSICTWSPRIWVWYVTIVCVLWIWILV